MSEKEEELQMLLEKQAAKYKPRFSLNGKLKLLEINSPSKVVYSSDDKDEIKIYSATSKSPEMLPQKLNDSFQISDDNLLNDDFLNENFISDENSLFSEITLNQNSRQRSQNSNIKKIRR